jgi:hypothetical protein
LRLGRWEWLLTKRTGCFFGLAGQRKPAAKAQSD